MHLLRKAGSPYWYAKFEAPRGSGRHVSKSTRIKASPKTKRAAIEAAIAIQGALNKRHAANLIGGDVTLLDVVEQYWSSEASKLKSADTYLQHLERIVDFLGEQRIYSEVETADAAAFVDHMDGLGLGDATINRHLSVWQRMHKVAGTKRGLPVRMIDWAECRRMMPEGRNRFIEVDDVQRLLHEIPQRGREIFVFGLMTGCRKNQILSLSWDRVQLPDARVQVWKKHRRSNVAHWIECNGTAAQILERRAEVRDGDLVFDTTNHRKDWEGALKRAGIEDFVFHDVRHTAATWLARVASLQVVRELLGHSDIKTTLRYAHVRQQDVRDAVNRMPGIGVVGLIGGEKKRA